MKQKSERYKSRRKTLWEEKENLTPTQEFLTRDYKEHYRQRHPELTETGEVEMINLYIYLVNVLFVKAKISKSMDIHVLVFKDINVLIQTFILTTGTIFDSHKISISEWIEYCVNIFRNVNVIADSLNNKNTFTRERNYSCFFQLEK